ncbi:hypothetical protein ADIMK_1959 [Marinobacterium lacunae]|uniref:Uncharacterized protein n=1 Tax=Marinobacterium lacunae TaxID=1232683 RepID=A0A081FZ77_9GAMM|nr:hypothetical protein ADIMK_1959 [Marinobacterium lacunae]
MGLATESDIWTIVYHLRRSLQSSLKSSQSWKNSQVRRNRRYPLSRRL